MKRAINVLCAAWLAGSALAAPAGDAEQRIRQVQKGLVPPVVVTGESPALKSLADRMAELKVPGVSIAVIHKGRIDWARGYGMTTTGGPPVTEKSLFQAASISKPVFALAVLHLVDEGRLKLDTNVNEYLKSWKLPDNEFTATEKATLRRLLSHSAGLTVHGFRGYAAGEKVPTTVQVLDGAAPANSKPIRVDMVPGTQQRYSGGGYTLAQLVLADVTGTPLPELMQDSVLKPLGMKLSSFEQPLPAKRIPEVAMPYRGDGKPVEGGPHTYPEMAAAGLWTTPTDLAHYALGVHEALAGKSKVISAATARAMLTPVINSHGIGPGLGGSTSRKYFTHNGGNEGYRCALVAYEDGEGAVVMTNGDNGGGLMYEVMRTIAHVYQWPDFAPASRTLAAVRPEALDRLMGVFELDDKSVYVVRRDGGQLVGNVIGNGPVALYPSADTELFAREVDVVVSFTADPGGAVNSVKHRAYGQERTGKRVEEARARTVLAAVTRDAERIKEQKADPRSASALRKLIAGLASGNPDYDAMSPQIADLTRQQLNGLRELFAGLGELKTLTFQRVTESGADEYLAEFAKGKLRIDMGVNDDGRMDKVYLEPR
jgi:CubicO group peptidase (beta-lactamase class C family)